MDGLEESTSKCNANRHDTLVGKETLKSCLIEAPSMHASILYKVPLCWHIMITRGRSTIYLSLFPSRILRKC